MGIYSFSQNGYEIVFKGIACNRSSIFSIIACVCLCYTYEKHLSINFRNLASYKEFHTSWQLLRMQEISPTILFFMSKQPLPAWKIGQVEGKLYANDNAHICIFTMCFACLQDKAQYCTENGISKTLFLKFTIIFWVLSTLRWIKASGSALDTTAEICQHVWLWYIL